MRDALSRTCDIRSAGLWTQSVGFACLLAWTNVAFFSRLIHYSTRNDLSHLNSTYSFACCGMVAALLVYALVGHRFVARPAPEGEVPAHPVAREVAATVAAVVIAAVTFVLVLVEHRLFTQPWCSIVSTCGGAAAAVLMVVWAQILLRMPGMLSPVRVVLPFLVAALLFVTVLCLPETPGTVATVLLPLVSLALYLAEERRLRAAAAGTASGRTGEHVGGAPVGTFVRALVCIALLSFAESLVRALFLDVDPANSIAYRWLYLGSTVVAGVVLVAAGTRPSASRSVRATVRVCLFVLTFLTLLAPAVHGLGIAADLPALVCYCLFSMLVWDYLAMTERAYRIDVRVLFGLGLGVTYAGCLAGTFLGGAVTSLFDLDWRAQELVALGCALLVLVSLLFIADEGVFVRLLDADDERPQFPRRFRLRIEDVARTYGLTAKETEVLTLAAKGRTTQRIREELGISTGTVNTHLAHIYKKLDVHDRQQLLDLLEARE